MKLVTAWIISVGLLLVTPLGVKAAHVRAESCVNLRESPSINSALITCVSPDEYVEIVRRSTNGAFAWAKDEGGRLWYRISVPGQDFQGWVVAEYIEF